MTDKEYTILDLSQAGKERFLAVSESMLATRSPLDGSPWPTELGDWTNDKSQAQPMTFDAAAKGAAFLNAYGGFQAGVVKLSTDLEKAELGVGELISYFQVLCDKYGADTPVLGMLADGGGDVVRLKICGVETAEFSEDGKMKIRIFCEEAE
jgi:hypothetical protein